jgi:hypothetical protein
MRAVRAPSCELYPGICLTTEDKARTDYVIPIPIKRGAHIFVASVTVGIFHRLFMLHASVVIWS